MLRVLATTLIALLGANSVAISQGKLMSAEAMSAMAKVRVVNQEMTQSAFGPTILVTVSNESNFSFRLLQLSCALMDGDKAVGVVDAQIYGFLPETTAVAEGNYEITDANNQADRAICRPSIAG